MSGMARMRGEAPGCIPVNPRIPSRPCRGVVSVQSVGRGRRGEGRPSASCCLASLQRTSGYRNGDRQARRKGDKRPPGGPIVKGFPALPVAPCAPLPPPFTHDDDLDDGKPRDHCGVVGIAAGEDVSAYLFYALQSLQHRGQESCGMTTLDGKFEMRTHKAMGLVDQVFDPAVVKKLRGHKGIGHARYSTSAGSTEENAQPQVVMSGAGGIALAHNGNIPNTTALMDELKAKGWAFYSGNDTEVVVRLLANKLTKHGGDHVEALRETMASLDGSYAFALLMGDQLYGVRDPWGIKPLCVGEIPGHGHVVASESVALDVVGARWLRDVEPGEVVRVSKDGVETVAKLPA